MGGIIILMALGAVVLLGYVIVTYRRDRQNAVMAASELENLKAERDTAQAKVQELTAIAQNSMADAKAIQAEHQQTLRQLEAIGGLSIIELDTRRGELQAEFDALKREIAQEQR
jgi:predicted histidine transporter YuiF (NhaC family)